MTDKELIKQIRINDNLAMKEILHRYGGYVAAVIYNATGSAISQNDRDEVVADVFIALWKNSSKLDEAKPLKPWLAVVARNKAINKARGQKDMPLIDEAAVEDTGKSPQQSIESAETSAILRETINSLSPQDREIFHRFYYWHQTSLTISRDMDIPESTIRSRLSRGREKLKAELTQRGYTL